MSEDTVDAFFVRLVSILETLPANWMDDDESYEHVHEWTQNWFAPYLTKERNYN
jgi:hypothetical protein